MERCTSAVQQSTCAIATAACIAGSSGCHKMYNACPATQPACMLSLFRRPAELCRITWHDPRLDWIRPFSSDRDERRAVPRPNAGGYGASSRLAAHAASGWAPMHKCTVAACLRMRPKPSLPVIPPPTQATRHMGFTIQELQYWYLAVACVLLTAITLPLDGTDWGVMAAYWSAADWLVLALLGSVVFVGLAFALQVRRWSAPIGQQTAGANAVASCQQNTRVASLHRGLSTAETSDAMSRPAPSPPPFAARCVAAGGAHCLPHGRPAAGLRHCAVAPHPGHQRRADGTPGGVGGICQGGRSWGAPAGRIAKAPGHVQYKI